MNIIFSSSFLRKNYFGIPSQLLLLIVLVLLCSYSDAVVRVEVISSFPVKDIEPYANLDGQCSFLFNIKAPVVTQGNIISSCQLLDSDGLQIGECFQSYGAINSTYMNYYFEIHRISEKSTPYTNISLHIAKTLGTDVYTLTYQNDTNFSYTCEKIPIGFVPTTTAGVVDILKSSYQTNTFQFRTYFGIDYQRPLTTMACVGSDISCQITYITLNKVMVTGTFSQYKTGLFEDTFKLNFTDTYFTVINNGLSNLDYNTLGYTIEKNKVFINSPNFGYLIQVNVNSTYSNILPPIDLPLVPLEGESSNKMTYYLNWGQSWQPKIIIEKTIKDFYQPLDVGPTSNLIIGPDFNDGFTNCLFKTNSKFSGSARENAPVRYFSYFYGLIGYDGTQRSYKIPLVNDMDSLRFKYLVHVPDTFSCQLIINPSLESSPPVNQQQQLLTQFDNDNTPPNLVSWEIVLFNSTHSILRIGATDDESGVDYIYIETYSHTFYLTKNNLAYGTNTNGVFEIFVPFKKTFYVRIVELQDRFGREVFYSNEYLALNFGVASEDPYRLDMITSFYFEPASVDVSTHSADVVLYMNISQSAQTRSQETTVFLEILFNPFLDNPLIQGVYNVTKQMYTFPFTVPAKMMPGKLEYMININGQSKIHSSYFNYQTSMMIQNSQNIDMTAPIVIRADAILPLSWDIEVNDTSGIKTAIVGISSEYDVRGKNFTLPVNGEVSFRTTITYVPETGCRAQKYWISYVYTEDMLGNKGESVRYSNTQMHPFYLFDNGISDIITTTCGPAPETTGPTLGSVDIVTKTNFTIANTQVQVRILVNDDTGVASNQLPVCYFSGPGNEILESYSNLVLVHSNGSASFACDFIFPLKFGPRAYLSIYGVFDIYYNYVGFGPEDLTSLGFRNSYTLTTADTLVIESASSVANSSDVLILYGNGFTANGNCLVNITLDNNEKVSVPPDLRSGFAFILYNLKPSYQYDVQIYCPLNSLFSNIVSLKGPLKDQPTPSPTNPPVTTPPNTTPPITCKSDCGIGKGYGKCVNGACICEPPHSGIDCLSTIDTATVIKTNPDKPTVNVTIPGTNNDGQTPQFSSFIYVVALRELDNTGSQITNYHFNSDKWIIVNEGSSSNDRVTTIQYKYTIDNSLNTTIVSTVQVFNTAANITFGNQQLYMNPSTIKFTFNITSYPFSKSTNLLQLVMTASLESTEKTGCSYKEFIDDQSNSQYLKLQIQDRSLFGRFIKFGIIDGREESITNTQLDSIYGGKQLSSSTSDQSYIGLNLRYFKTYALIDPDFSVLIEQNTARDQENSICTSESKKLTNAQIAGIVVGGAVFLFIIAGLAIYIYTKKSNSAVAFKLRKIGTR